MKRDKFSSRKITQLTVEGGAGEGAGAKARDQATKQGLRIFTIRRRTRIQTTLWRTHAYVCVWIYMHARPSSVHVCVSVRRKWKWKWHTQCPPTKSPFSATWIAASLCPRVCEWASMALLVCACVCDEQRTALSPGDTWVETDNHLTADSPWTTRTTTARRHRNREAIS